MRSWISRHRRTAVAMLGLGVAGLAWASPWDIDMFDSAMVKPYEWKMRPTVPEGSVPRANGGAMTRPAGAGTYQNDWEATVDRFALPDTLHSPFGDGEDQVKLGQTIFGINCQPCHGPEGKGGGPVTQNDPAQNIARFPVPAPMLSGPGAITPIRSDGYIYGTIRNGGAVMPAHAVMLTDKERWSVVSYIRSLEGTAYTPPAPTTPATGGTP